MLSVFQAVIVFDIKSEVIESETESVNQTKRDIKYA